MQHADAENIGPEYLARGFASMLQPLAELAIHLGMQPHEFRRSVNKAAVKAICSRVRRDEMREPTAARISTIFGLTARESTQLLEEENQALRLEKLATEIMAVITRWHTDSNFSSLYGVPYELSVTENGEHSVEALVSASEVTASTEVILHELLTSGCAEKIGDSKVRATNRTYKLPTNTNTQLARFFQVVKNFNDTLVQNIVRVKDGEPSFLEIDVHTDAPVSAATFATVSRTAGEKLVSIVHEVDSLLNQTNRIPDPNGVIGGIGVYVYADRSTMTQANIESISKETKRVGL